MQAGWKSPLETEHPIGARYTQIKDTSKMQIVPFQVVTGTIIP